MKALSCVVLRAIVTLEKFPSLREMRAFSQALSIATMGASSVPQSTPTRYGCYSLTSDKPHHPRAQNQSITSFVFQIRLRTSGMRSQRTTAFDALLNHRLDRIVFRGSLR